MPTTYTHYRFGEQVLKRLPEDIERICLSEADLYRIGLHGPDILFYYHALQKNPVNTCGSRIHGEPGSAFFTKAIAVIQDKQREGVDVTPYYAYIYGVLCHFTLDLYCHGFVGKVEKSGYSHAEIESELDRALLVQDGKNPVTEHLIKHIHPTKEGAQVIAAFYEGIDAEQVYASLQQMIQYHHILRAPSRCKRIFLYGALKIVGQYEKMAGLLISYEPNQNLMEATRKLQKLCKSAEDTAVYLISTLKENVEDDIKLSEWYGYDFEGDMR